MAGGMMVFDFLCGKDLAKKNSLGLRGWSDKTKI